eukprot:TRINITY_DN443_c1_g2_i1.p1 TRINITY_DN443_c1_g2~~TRINITY_DN443_c1_g2_i1.p1  ORF type:complete len:323 (+),score=108.26 TRINITY_DN443_c1_g2_i1:58-1026(+)
MGNSESVEINVDQVSHDVAEKYHYNSDLVKEIITQYQELSEGKSVKLNKFVEILGQVSEKIDHPAIRDPYFAKNCFTLFDSDNNGKIDINEFISGASVICSGDLVEKAKLVFRSFDSNNDNSLTYKEVQDGLKLNLRNANKLVIEQLKEYYRSQEDISSILRTFLALFIGRIQHYVNEEIVPVWIENIFKEGDINHDGSISMEEWIQLSQENKDVKRFLQFAIGELIIDMEDLKKKKRNVKDLTVIICFGELFVDYDFISSYVNNLDDNEKSKLKDSVEIDGIQISNILEEIGINYKKGMRTGKTIAQQDNNNNAQQNNNDN